MILRTCCTLTAYTLLLLEATATLAANPPATPSEPARQEAAAAVLAGTVTETMNTGGYTYIQLDTTQGKRWVAIPETKVSVGQAVTCAPGMTMTNFTSKTLNRTFDAIIFSPGIDGGSLATATAAPQTMAASGNQETGSFASALKAESGGTGTPATDAKEGGVDGMGQSAGSAGAVVPSADVNVNKATGANSYSVGECFEKARELDNTTVRVRGKVMKVSRMIMGKNWLHLQDGTGNPLHNHHDLVVTTMEDPGENVVVTVEGTLHANRDFGAGYAYEALIENAKVEK